MIKKEKNVSVSKMRPIIIYVNEIISADTLGSD